MDATLRQGDQSKGEDFGSFAHFASCWWGGAQSQLVLQGDLRAGAISFERLLGRFLDLCRIAQEDGVGVAYEYDRHEWSSIPARIECKDPELGPDQTFERINISLLSALRAEISCKTFRKLSIYRPSPPIY